MEQAQLTGRLTSLAGRYAKTLFDLAGEHKALGQVREQFTEFMDFLSKNDALSQQLLSPSFSRLEHMAVFDGIAKKNGVHKVLAEFFDLLAGNRRLGSLVDIFEIFTLLCDEQSGVSHGEVISAVALSKSQENLVLSILKKHVQGELSLNFSTDPQCLGGILVRLGNNVIDLTVANQLNLIATAMKGNA